MKKLKLRRHESFSLREGWTEKVLNSYNDKDSDPFRKNQGIKILGIGSNMVKSLKYWMIACDILMTKSNRTYLTEFGKILKKYDPFMENEFSWWFVHYNLATNVDQAPIIYYMFNVYEQSYIDKEGVVLQIKDYLLRNEYVFNEKYISDDLNMFLRLYCSNHEDTNPEENMGSPLRYLGLLEKGIGKNEFNLKNANYNKLSVKIVYYFLQELYADKGLFDINEALICDKSPVKVFRIDKGLFSQYLNEMRLNGWITLNKTAGINTAYINKYLSINDIFEELIEEV